LLCDLKLLNSNSFFFPHFPFLHFITILPQTFLLPFPYLINIIKYSVTRDIYVPIILLQNSNLNKLSTFQSSTTIINNCTKLDTQEDHKTRRVHNYRKIVLHPTIPIPFAIAKKIMMMNNLLTNYNKSEGFTAHVGGFITFKNLLVGLLLRESKLQKIFDL
jgi:hypothetical protein